MREVVTEVVGHGVSERKALTCPHVGELLLHYGGRPRWSGYER